MASAADRTSPLSVPSAWEPGPPDYRFSTDDLPDRDRIAIFREIVSRQMLRHDMAPFPDHPFRVHGTARPLQGGLFAVWSEGSPHHIRRSREYLADGDDSLLFQWTNSHRYIEHRGHEVVLRAGDAVLFSSSETRSVTLPTTFKTITIKIPRNALGSILRDPDASFAHAIAGDSGALRLLLRYLVILRDELPALTPEMQSLASAHICDLLAIALGATRDGAEAARRGGLGAARLQSIKADIEENLCDGDLSVVCVAARHGTTPRTIQFLFENAGTTFTEYLRDKRLARARRMLTSPRFSNQRIIDIAFACGFGDVSNFNRAFRARFGATPSEVRAACAGTQAQTKTGRSTPTALSGQ